MLSVNILKNQIRDVQILNQWYPKTTILDIHSYFMLSQSKVLAIQKRIVGNKRIHINIIYFNLIWRGEK